MAETHQLPQLPASVNRVLDILAGEPKTMQQIREESGLARRTVYGAVRRLKAMNLICEQTSLRDSRQSYIWLCR